MSQPTTSPSYTPQDEENRTFSQQLKEIRCRLEGKQEWLSREIGCSAAAVSFWESGARLPNMINLRKIVAALDRAGASTPELVDLRRSWTTKMVARVSRARSAPKPSGLQQSQPESTEPRAVIPACLGADAIALAPM